MPTRAPHSPHLRLLLALTAIPTAAGREQRVIAFIRAWAAKRPDLVLADDPAGNLLIQFAAPPRGPGAPLFFTAHLDHPAFVVERILAPGVAELSFRGGVMDVFFKDAPITLYTENDAAIPAKLSSSGEAPTPTPAGSHHVAEFSARRGAALKPGDVGTWKLPKPRIDRAGVLHTPACDDLAAAAAALAAYDNLRAIHAKGQLTQDVRLLFTRAEEIGFIGAIAATKHGSIPLGSRILALENSRAFDDSPVGGGPIVRVGDRLSTFTPWLTAACASRAKDLFGDTNPPASKTRKKSDPKPRPWQRKLMAGGACEASVFCQAGYDATCLCLPLGNYHNMAHLAELQANTYNAKRLGPPRAAPEFIHTRDYLGLVDLLTALGEKLPTAETPGARFDQLYESKKYVLKMP